jgi:hypothetical protein
MEYKIFERDFIVRTQTTIQQYECYVLKQVPKQEQFEITLLINCLLGLLVLPNQRLYVNIPDIPIGQLKDWGLQEKHIIEGKGLPMKQIIRHMRNSVAHFRLKPLGDGSKITQLKFWDEKFDESTYRTEKNFEAVIPVETLRMFVQKLTESVLTN